MSQNFRKLWEKEDTYIDRTCLKHKHNYTVKHLLVVTNINIHASANYYGKKEYYYVLKCDQCNSFIPDRVKGNPQHHIFYEKDVDFNLPTITANTMAKNPVYCFSKLIDVNVTK